MKLSIIVPVYNEEKTVQQILAKLLAAKIPVQTKEIIMIDDGSTDKTNVLVKKVLGKQKNIKLITHARNQGKGAAVRSGLKIARGDYIIIQDADLEYNPNEIAKLLSHVTDHDSVVVYGSRLKRLPNFKKDERTTRFFVHYVGNKMLSLITSVLFLQWITDMESCYKLFPKKALTRFKLRAHGFEFEPEITAKLLKYGYKITEVSISTNPRSIKDGKKLRTVSDGSKALWTLFKYRFTD